MAEALRVFVYGTLKPGEANYQAYCAGRVVECVEAIAFGTLYDLPLGYPAMTVGSAPVHGYLLTFHDLTVLQELDELEDYSTTRPPEDNEYRREWIEVFENQKFLQGHRRTLGFAWIYLMSEALVKTLGGSILVTGCWTSSL